jgi:hypothetical protein
MGHFLEDGWTVNLTFFNNSTASPNFSSPVREIGWIIAVFPLYQGSSTIEYGHFLTILYECICNCSR